MSNLNSSRTSGSVSNSVSNSSNSSNSTSSSTFRSTSFSTVSSNINGAQRSYSEATYSDPSGTRVHRTSQEPGQAPREERIEYDSAGRRIQGQRNGQESRGRIEDVTDEREKEKEAERLYEEGMEEEYAKREGGA
ncbi:hypothetical protein BCR34DRAFT_549884 [Clohesyomyces aquaticus]|uniref:Uncharacterized protein n=1 Tax=Clohesyomyces aquaticus TaxID=1231657 RepID=A0A1Y1YBG3_9PLEO|nr:hypothetical protein BCR34DRAFT_549884 [Clohesyomyces aquaticus]